MSTMIKPEELIRLAGFKATMMSHSNHPNATIYAALHQDYSTNYVGDDPLDWDESAYGELATKRLLANNRGHFGPLEHISTTIAFGHYPHNVIQQATRHRLASFDVQSFRYTGDNIGALYRYHDETIPDEMVEKIIYLRPCGVYTDRHGGKYIYSKEDRDGDIKFARSAILRYIAKVERGMPLEQARGMLPFDYRQHFVMSANLRSFMHFLDIRGLADAQIEIRAMSHQIFTILHRAYPEVMEWYKQNRYKKNKIAP